MDARALDEQGRHAALASLQRSFAGIALCMWANWIYGVSNDSHGAFLILPGLAFIHAPLLLAAACARLEAGRAPESLRRMATILCVLSAMSLPTYFLGVGMFPNLDDRIGALLRNLCAQARGGDAIPGRSRLHKDRNLPAERRLR